MKRLISLLGVSLATLLAPLLILQPVSAANFFEGCDGITGDATCDSADPAGTTGRIGAANVIGKIITGLLWLIGALSIIMIIFGSIRFLFSRGEQAAVQSGKNIVLYSVIGLAVTLLAAVIVRFIAEKL